MYIICLDMSRIPFIGGNWKSFNDKSKVDALVKGLNGVKFPASVQVAVSPSFLYLQSVQLTLNKDYLIAAQNCSLTDDGAYTGEISAKGLTSAGLQWVILGHSERRSLYGESNKVVGDKVKKALASGLNVIACIGESLDERKSGKTMDVVTGQLAAIVEATKDQWSNVVIAYEPVWAIGTGVVATPEQAQETHEGIRKWMAAKVSKEAAASVRIIYGGSVKPDNAKSLYAKVDVDGFLVGGTYVV